MSDNPISTEGSYKETFLIQVHFQQNATWQGTITWTDKKKTLQFRSTLEMIKLIDEALSEHSTGQDKPAVWE